MAAKSLFYVTFLLLLSGKTKDTRFSNIVVKTTSTIEVDLTELIYENETMVHSGKI